MSEQIKSFRDLEVWQQGIALAVTVHRLTSGLPRVEQFRLGDQLIRAATSIPGNIAEGYGRRRRAEYIRFLDIANGSRCELETHLEVCHRLGLIPPSEASPILTTSERIGQMLTRLRQRLTGIR